MGTASHSAYGEFLGQGQYVGSFFGTEGMAKGMGSAWTSDCGALAIDASLSNAIFGKSSEVQPPACQTLIIIKV